MERGPYDYHLATEAELFAGYDHEPGGIASGAGPAVGGHAAAAHDHEEGGSADAKSREEDE